jgi:putative flippase GtrA
VKSLAARLYQRLLHLRFEIGKFGVVGLLAYAVDTIVTTVLVYAEVGSIRSKVIATVIAATAAFIGNRYWTWRDRDRSSLGREYFLYFTFNAVGLGIQLAALYVSHSVLGSIWPIFATKLADVIAMQLFGNGIATVFRFWAYRRFVFVATTPAEATR